MDYAGCFPDDHQIHKKVSALRTGDHVALAAGRKGVEIHDQDGFCVGRLASRSAEGWKKRLGIIHTVRVVSMISRTRLDPDENFQNRINTKSWEMPVLEVVSRYES